MMQINLVDRALNAPYRFNSMELDLYWADQIVDLTSSRTRLNRSSTAPQPLLNLFGVHPQLSLHLVAERCIAA